MNGAFIENIFIAILNMSISASWLIIAVIIIRALIGKAPKGLRYVLWAFVAIRLLCPFSVESAWSLMPSAETFSMESIYSNAAEMNSGAVVLNGVVNSVLSDKTSSDVNLAGNQNSNTGNISAENQNINIENGSVELEVLADETVDITDRNTPATKNKISLQGIVYIATRIWLVGLAGMLVYSLISFIRLRNTIDASLQVEDNLWVCDEIQSPFIFGLISPRIYLPSFITQEQVPYIVAHENEHLKYRDHWWKPLGFAILTIHWFNPLVWIAYILLCRDIELACDERVIRMLDEEEKKKYSKSLLLCSNPRHMISACPVAFGEIGVKERIKNILNYRKPSAWIIGIGVAVCVILAICFMTNPAGADIVKPIEGAVKIELRDGSNGQTVEITDAEVIARITDNVNAMEFVREGSNWGTGGWSYWLTWYDADGNEIESLVVLGNNRISGENFFYKSTKGSFECDFYDELLKNGGQDLVEDTETGMPEDTESTEDSEEIEIMGTPLSEAELEWFATEFFNSDENLMPNMFLSSEYDCPENIDLNNLFYGGADGRSASVSEEEKQLLFQRYEGMMELDIAKTTADEMDDILTKYMGITLADTNKVDLDILYYLEEYDAYYNVAGDTEYSRYDLLAGWTNENGTITLIYKDALSSIETMYQVTLKQENGNYYFMSNIQMPENMRVFTGQTITEEKRQMV